MESIRRVITGIDENGVSRFVSDEIVQGVCPPTVGTFIVPIFGSDEAITVPNGGEVPEGLRFFPKKPAQFRYIIFTYPPKGTPPPTSGDPEADWAEAERMTPGMGDVISDNSAMHATSTVDLEFVLDGEITLTVEDGETKTLRKGDCIVQCGTKHAWSNETDKPATVLLVFIGANQDVSRYATPGH
jgi:mannose-6-phosphate isomerase-like protein (cupin superfamily)